MAELKKRHEFWLALLIVVLFVGLAWRSDEFLTFGNLYDLANNYAMLTILACGLFVVLISGIIFFLKFSHSSFLQMIGCDSFQRKVRRTIRCPLQGICLKIMILNMNPTE